MRNRRYRASGNRIVVHITNRTVVALPFRCRKYMQVLLLGALARAQTLYRVNICHFQWMGNHYHLILAGAASHISPFMNQVDGEIAKYLKRLYPGLFQTRVWQARFKEQPLLLPADVQAKIVYLYANPSKAGLVSRIDDWPGVTSWNMYRNGTRRIEAHYIRPGGIRQPVPRKMSSLKEHSYIKKLCKLYGERCELVLTPDAWKRCFVESASLSHEEIFNGISGKLRKLEEEFSKERPYPPAGRKALKAMGHRPEYRSKTKSRTPFVICGDAEVRREFIEIYREFCDRCRQAWRAWSTGLVSEALFPKGAYRPGMRLVELRV